MPTARGDFKLSMRVTGSNDAHIGMSQKNLGAHRWTHWYGWRGKREHHQPMFEIVLGGWGNRRSCMRRWPQDHLCNGNSGGWHKRFLRGTRWWHNTWTSVYLRRLGPHMQVWGGNYPGMMHWENAFYKPGDWSQGRRRGSGYWWRHDWTTRWNDWIGRGIRRDDPKYLYVMTGWGNHRSYWHVCLPSPGAGVRPQYLGCYHDDQHRDFITGPRHYRFSPTTCANRCSKFHGRYYKYFALQYNGWCACDNRYGTMPGQRVRQWNRTGQKNHWMYTKTPNNQCNMGGRGQGGPWRNAVYRTRRF